jgi:four helix bundle protein
MRWRSLCKALNMSFTFENLNIYQRSLCFVAEIESIISELRTSMSRNFIDQLSCAALSVPLNIAEGNGRWHKGDKRNFFWIARGSVFECVPLIETLKRKNLLQMRNIKI